MALSRYQIRNEYGLADKELYQGANKEDPEALLEGASMAGLVGVLRQLGDLAEFAAEVFNCLHEQLITTAARGHGLTMRLQQMEAELPSIEIPILSQTDHSTFFYDLGLEWHSNLQTEENLIAPRNLPLCIMDSYEECRGPPQLFLLDKFAVAGSGSCLKRYSDPSLLKTPTASALLVTSKLSKHERPKKKGLHTTSKDIPGASHTNRLHHLFSLEHVENGHRNPELHVKLKRRQLNAPINSSSGTGYMEKFIKNSSPYCERVHGTLDHSSPAMETQVTVCSVPEGLPIPSLVYPNSGDTRKYNEMEMESIERLETQEITVNNGTNAPASTKSEAKESYIDDKAACNLGFPGFGQTQICTDADATQTEVLAQFSNVLHHSPEEEESSLLCTDIQRSSSESKPHKAEGSAVKVDLSFSQMTPDIDSAGLEQTPFSLSCYENSANLPEDSESLWEHQSNKANADENGLKSSEACEVFEVGRDPETCPEYLSMLTQLPQDASDGVEDDHSQHVFNVETGSEISLSALVEDKFSSITNQEIEALEPEGISSEDGKNSFKETPAALKSDFLLPNQYNSEFDNSEDLSLAVDAQDNVVPKEDETNSQDEQSGRISTSEISSENGTLMSDTLRDLHTGYRNPSASSYREDALANPDLAEISSYSGQEDPQTMPLVTDDSSEVPIPDTQSHGTCFVGDVDHENQTGLSNKASEIMPERDLENISDPHESLLGTQDCLSPEHCIQTQDQWLESPPETGSTSITALSESLPTQDGPVGVQGSPEEEALTCNEKLFPSSITEIEALHAPHQETFTSLNDHHISESILSMDLTDEEDCLDVSSESMVPFSISLHETPQAELDITPPLPPLPPTQWWMGKLVESTEMPSPAGSGNNKFYIHRDENTQNGSVQASEAQYPSEASVTAGENHKFHVYTEEYRVEAVSACAQTTPSEPSKATEEQSPWAVNGTYMESTPKRFKKGSEKSFALAETAQGIEADWRTEAMALEWFSQNLREHTNPNPAKLEEEQPQLDHPLEPPGETKFPQTLRDNSAYDQNEKVGKLPRDKDSLVIGIDRSMLRKVSERNRTQVGARVDENNSLLEIIRSKSFNLRPAEASVRPNLQVAVPKTNLKVAAILEKANTLRQAMAGSDDDHDSDSWSE
ncbi:Protein SCAR4 [Cardamine amara subsp. amara]|uniref:Protein SCAR n=1 Tax=Cardamine amara subsp. amara TaxID=228776 RepID=A0ABD1ATX0_CARAN